MVRYHQAEQNEYFILKLFMFLQVCRLIKEAIQNLFMELSKEARL